MSKNNKNSVIKKTKHMVKMLIICFVSFMFLFGCGIKNVKTIVEEYNNSDKENLVDIKNILETNKNDKIIELFGSIFINQKKYDVNGKVYDVTKIYQDENKNKAYYYYKVKENYENELEEMESNYFDVFYNDNYYFVNNKHITGINYDIDGKLKNDFDTKSGIQMSNNRMDIISSYERVTEHFYDDLKNEGVIKTYITDFKNTNFSGLDKKYIDILGIDNIVKVVNTYVYDVETYFIKSKKVEVVNGKGQVYLVEENIYSYGEGMEINEFNDLLNNIKNNILVDVSKIEDKNTYDSLLKKHNNISIQTFLNRDFKKMLAYEVYYDFRGIKSFKSWDWTINTLYQWAMRHVRNAEGIWFKNIRNDDLELDNTMKESEKGYYEKYNSIESIFERKSILIDEKYLKTNYVDGNVGHIIYETNRLSNIYKNYNKNVIDEFDNIISNIIVDYTYNIKNFDIEKVDFIVIKKDNGIDENMIELNVNYDIEDPSYIKTLYIDKNFKLDYEKLVEANTEKNILAKNTFVKIKDTRWKNAIEKDKEIMILKNKDGELTIIENMVDSYIHNKEGYIFVEGNSTNGLRKEITNENYLDEYIKNAFEWDDICKIYYEDDSKNSLIDTNLKIIAAYNDLGKGKLLTTNDKEDMRVEYTFNLKSKMVEDIKYYKVDKKGLSLIYVTTIEIG